MRVWQRVVQRLAAALYKQRFAAIGVGVLLIAGLVYLGWQSQASMMAASVGLQPVEVDAEPIAQRGDSLILTLREKSGQRRISMQVDQAGALAIARERGQVAGGSAPRAYDLFRDVVQQMGGRIERVIISTATRDQFNAQIIVSTGTDTRPISASPGDATAVALKSGARIYVEEQVLREFGVRPNN